MFLCNNSATKLKYNHNNNNNSNNNNNNDDDNNNNNNNSSLQLKFMQQQCRLYKFCSARCIKCNTQLATQIAKFVTHNVHILTVSIPTNKRTQLNTIKYKS